MRATPKPRPKDAGLESLFTKADDRTFFQGEHKYRYVKEFAKVRIHLLDVVRTSSIMVNIEDGLDLSLERERLEEKHSLGISATGDLDGDRITIINRDGTTGGTHNTIRVEIREEPRWDERMEPRESEAAPRYYRRRDGVLVYDKSELHLSLPVPSAIFRKAWEQLERETRVGSVDLRCQLDLFMSDPERHLRDAFDRRDFYIEADYFYNLGYFESLTIGSHPKLPTAKPKDDFEDEPVSQVSDPADPTMALFQQAKFNERLLQKLLHIAWVGFAVALAALLLNRWG